MGWTAEQLADREAIREAVVRYCRGVDRLDPDEMRRAYWPEATDDHGTFVGNAYEFVDHCMVSHRRWAWTMHSVFNHLIELDADGVHARGEVQNITHLCRADTGAIDAWYGRYLDHYEKRGDEWRIIERVCVHHGTATSVDPPMAIDAARFRQDSFDRPAEGRPVGP